MNVNEINSNIDKLTVDKLCAYLNAYPNDNKESPSVPPVVPSTEDVSLVEKFLKGKDPLQTMKKISSLVPNGEQQFEGVKDFYNGEISYAEMRARCG